MKSNKPIFSNKSQQLLHDITANLKKEYDIELDITSTNDYNILITKDNESVGNITISTKHFNYLFTTNSSESKRIVELISVDEDFPLLACFKMPILDGENNQKEITAFMWNYHKHTDSNTFSLMSLELARKIRELALYSDTITSKFQLPNHQKKIGSPIF